MQQPLHAQFDFPSMGSRSASLGGISMGLDDSFSTTRNIGGLAFIEHSFVGVSILSTYLEPTLSHKNISAAYQSENHGAWGVSYTHYGDLEYNEQQATLAYGLKIGRIIAAGLSLDYLHSGSSDSHYPNLDAITFSLGLQCRPSDKLTLGFKLFNPTSVHLSAPDGQRLPPHLNLGLGYQLYDDLFGAVEIEKNGHYASRLRLGIEYTYHEHFFARAGIATHPGICTFGLGYSQKHYAIDLCAQIHNVLGFSPQITALYSF